MQVAGITIQASWWASGQCACSVRRSCCVSPAQVWPSSLASSRAGLSLPEQRERERERVFGQELEAGCARTANSDGTRAAALALARWMQLVGRRTNEAAEAEAEAEAKAEGDFQCRLHLRESHFFHLKLQTLAARVASLFWERQQVSRPMKPNRLSRSALWWKPVWRLPIRASSLSLSSSWSWSWSRS